AVRARQHGNVPPAGVAGGDVSEQVEEGLGHGDRAQPYRHGQAPGLKGKARGGSGSRPAGGIRRRAMAYRAMDWNSGADAIPPYSVTGWSRTAAITSLGAEAGRDPSNEAVYRPG